MPDLFGDKPVDLDRQEIIGELERELRMRAQVYPRWILTKKLRQDVGTRRIALMQAAIDLLKSGG